MYIVRLVLNPALCQTWRDETTLQIGATPGLATVLGGLGQVERSVVTAMNGQHDLQALRELAVELGGTAATADRVVDVLMSSGSAVDIDQAGSDVPSPSHSEQRRVPEQSSVGLQERSPDGGRSALQARGRLQVEVNGAGRIGAQVARLLAAAGIGEVTVDDPAPVQAADVCPGGLPTEAMGRARDRTLNSRLRADALSPSPLPQGGTPDFVVLAPTSGTGRDEAADLLRLGIPHLLVQVLEITGVVGPLVVPGESSCLRCHDLHRTDRDRHWPLLLDQLARRPPSEPACDIALSATVAGLASVQALAHLDGFVAAAVDGTIEVTLPYGLPRRRSWARHRDCGCGWE